MNKTTHLIGGATAAIGVMFLTTVPLEPSIIIPYAVGAIAGSLLPDIDHPKSTVSRKVPILRSTFKVLTSMSDSAEHRGMAHSILFAIPWLIAAIFVKIPIIQSLCLGMFAGYVSHLTLDSLNPAGCPLLFPWKKKLRIGKIRTGGFGEAISAILLVALSAGIIYLRFFVLKAGVVSLFIG